MQLKVSVKLNWKKVVVFLTIVLLAFVFSMQCSNGLWHYGEMDVDSSVYAYVAMVIRRGGMPYRDAFDHKGPLIYLIDAAGMAISYWRGIWVMEFLFLLVTFFCIYFLCRRVAGRKFSVLALILSTTPLFVWFQGGNMTEEYTMAFIAVSLLIFETYFRKGTVSFWQLIVCGVCFGAVCLLRINMAVLWVVMGMGAMIQCLFRRNWKELGRIIGGSFLGVAIIVVPVFLWLIKGNAFHDFIRDYWNFNLTYTSRLDPSIRTLERAHTFYYFLSVPIVIFSVALLIYAIVSRKNLFDILLLLTFIASLAAISMSGKRYEHYAMILVPLLGYPIAKLSTISDDGKMRKLAWSLAGSVAVILALPVWTSGFRNTISRYKTRGTDFISEDVRQTVNIIQDNSAEDDRILVNGSWDIIYVLSHRLASSKYSYQYPICSIDPALQEEFIQEITDNPPELIVLKENTYEYDALVSFIDKGHYNLVGQVYTGQVSIYKRTEE